MDAWSRVIDIYRQLGVLDWAPDLYIHTDPTINAFAGGGSEVHMYLALTELVRDSDSELSFVLAQELGHIVQQHTNSLYFVYDNAEFDADVSGALAILVAGYDPYAGSGTLSKLSMATGDVGLAQQFEDQNAEDAHKSFVGRIETMYNAFKAICAVDPDMQSPCDQYRSQFHSHFPGNAVLWPVPPSRPR